MKSDLSAKSRIENLQMSLNNLNKGKPNQQHPKK